MLCRHLSNSCVIQVIINYYYYFLCLEVYMIPEGLEHYLLCRIFLLLFLLRQVFTDDEALTKLLHFGRSLARSITFRISHPLSFMSSSTLSIHFFLGLPLLLNPSTAPCSTFAGILSFSILITCPYHVSLLLLILSA